MNDEQEYQDPDDIFRDIDEDDEDAVLDEHKRLLKKRRGYKASFTIIINSINNMVTASRGANGTLNKSQANREALLRAREKLEVRHEKLQTLNTRQLHLTKLNAEEDEKLCQDEIDNAAERYNQVVRDLAKLDLELQPQPNWNDNNYHNEQHNHLKPIIALKPEYTLSFDNTPTELNTWSISFRSYFDASKFDTLPVVQQQAF